MKKYRWKDGCRLSDNDAESVGALVESIDVATPRWLVEQARPNKSPIHHLFEWDDAAAAAAHRLDQARHMIRSLVITVEEKEPIEVRAMCHVPSEDGYVAHTRVFNDADMRAQVVEQAKREYKAMARRYHVYSELKKVHEAIEQL